MPGGQSTDTSKAVEVLNPSGSGPVLILCEHASKHVPSRFQGLGLNPDALNSHAAWDPGARGVSVKMSAALDAPLVASCVSRLVYDCNRPPDAPSAMIERSETFDVPGNKGLTHAARADRIETVYRPFCDAVGQVISTRRNQGLQTVLVTIHSFTPVYFGVFRPVEIGVLHDVDTRVADIMMAQADLVPHRRIERNEPYSAADGVTHSLQLHGIAHGLANVMLEVRNDLLKTEADETVIAKELLVLLQPALSALSTEGVTGA